MKEVELFQIEDQDKIIIKGLKSDDAEVTIHIKNADGTLTYKKDKTGNTLEGSFPEGTKTYNKEFNRDSFIMTYEYGEHKISIVGTDIKSNISYPKRKKIGFSLGERLKSYEEFEYVMKEVIRITKDRIDDIYSSDVITFDFGTAEDRYIIKNWHSNNKTGFSVFNRYPNTTNNDISSLNDLDLYIQVSDISNRNKDYKYICIGNNIPCIIFNNVKHEINYSEIDIINL